MMEIYATKYFWYCITKDLSYDEYSTLKDGVHLLLGSRFVDENLFFPNENIEDAKKQYLTTAKKIYDRDKKDVEDYLMLKSINQFDEFDFLLFLEGIVDFEKDYNESNSGEFLSYLSELISEKIEERVDRELINKLSKFCVTNENDKILKTLDFHYNNYRSDYNSFLIHLEKIYEPLLQIPLNRNVWKVVSEWILEKRKLTGERIINEEIEIVIPKPKESKTISKQGEWDTIHKVIHYCIEAEINEELTKRTNYKRDIDYVDFLSKKFKIPHTTLLSQYKKYKSYKNKLQTMNDQEQGYYAKILEKVYLKFKSEKKEEAMVKIENMFSFSDILKNYNDFLFLE